MFFLHPIALGIIVILHPSGIFMLPAGLELRSTALGQHKNAFGAENTNDPAGKGCKNLPFLLPQRANNGKGEFSQLQKWMRQRGFSAWGLQTRPLAALWAHFVLNNFQLFHFHTGEPIVITPEG